MKRYEVGSASSAAEAESTAATSCTCNYSRWTPRGSLLAVGSHELYTMVDIYRTTKTEAQASEQRPAPSAKQTPGKIIGRTCGCRAVVSSFVETAAAGATTAAGATSTANLYSSQF